MVSKQTLTISHLLKLETDSAVSEVALNRMVSFESGMRDVGMVKFIFTWESRINLRCVNGS